VLREGSAKYPSFPEFDIESNEESPMYEVLDVYLKTVSDYIENYSEEFDPKRTFISEEDAKKYIERCGVGNVERITLNMIDSTIQVIESLPTQALTGV